MCLELGRGVRGAIAHTQPRRLAARTVAERIADELNVTLGEAVGYAVRFNDQLARGHAAAADDRRPAAGRDPARPAAAPLRHDHHRRGARAQPQHRLPARLPQADPARAAGSEGDHHLGDDRPGALRRALRRRADRRGLRAHVSRSRSATDRSRRGRRPDRRDRRRRRASCCARGPATSSSSSPASARSATPPTRSRAGCATTSRSCRCSRASRRPSSSASGSRTPTAASCSPPTSPRRR